MTVDCILGIIGLVTIAVGITWTLILKDCDK